MKNLMTTAAFVGLLMTGTGTVTAIAQTPQPATGLATAIAQLSPTALAACATLSSPQPNGHILGDPGAAMNGHDFVVFEDYQPYLGEYYNGQPCWVALPPGWYGLFNFGPAAAPQPPDRFLAISTPNGRSITELYQYDELGSTVDWIRAPTRD